MVIAGAARPPGSAGDHDAAYDDVRSSADPRDSGRAADPAGAHCADAMARGDGVELLVGELAARNLVANQLLGVGQREVVAVRLARFDERGEPADDGFDLGEQLAV